MPGTPEYYSAIGMDASQHGFKPTSEWGVADHLARTLPQILPIFGPMMTHAIFGKEMELSRNQQQADAIGKSMLPLIAPMMKSQQGAPTLMQAQGSMGGFPGGDTFIEPSQMTPIQPNQPIGMTSAGSSIVPTPQELQTLTQRSGEFSPLYNPQARLTPAQMALTEPIREGKAALGTSGQIIPTALAGVENKKVTPEEIASARAALQGGTPSVPLPPTIASKVLEEGNKAPSTMSDENIISQELFGPGMTVNKLTTKEQFQQLSERLQETRHPVGIHKNAIAKLYGAKNYDDLARNNTPLTAPEVAQLQQYAKDTGTPLIAKVGMPRLVAADATIYQRGIAFAGAGAAARAKGELEQPAGPEAANYFDVNSLQKGRLIAASDRDPGITKLDLRQSKTYKFINPNDQQELQQLNNARNTLRELFSRSEYILEPTDQLKASTIQPALIWTWARGGPGADEVVKDKSGTPVGTKGEIARAFLDQMKSFGGVVARGVLAERGVLTDADRNVAMQAGVNASDTIQTMKQKQQFFEKLMQFQFKSIARLSDNPTAPVADLVKEKEALMKEAQKFKPAPPMPEGSTATSVAPFNDADKEKRYQEWKAKHQ